MEWLEGVGEAGGHAGQRQAAGGVRVGRPEQLKCTQPLQMGHLNAYSVLRWGRWHTGQGKERGPGLVHWPQSKRRSWRSSRRRRRSEDKGGALTAGWRCALVSDSEHPGGKMEDGGGGLPRGGLDDI